MYKSKVSINVFMGTKKQFSSVLTILFYYKNKNKTVVHLLLNLFNHFLCINISSNIYIYNKRE